MGDSIGIMATPPCDNARHCQVGRTLLVIDDIRARLDAAFQPEAARGVQLRYQLRFDRDDPFYLDIRDGVLAIHAGECNDPTVTIFFDCHQTAVEVLTRRSDAVAAFMNGRLRSDGHLIQSLMLFARYFGPAGG